MTGETQGNNFVWKNYFSVRNSQKINLKKSLGTVKQQFVYISIWDMHSKQVCFECSVYINQCLKVNRDRLINSKEWRQGEFGRNHGRCPLVIHDSLPSEGHEGDPGRTVAADLYWIEFFQHLPSCCLPLTFHSTLTTLSEISPLHFPRKQELKDDRSDIKSLKMIANLVVKHFVFETV